MENLLLLSSIAFIIGAVLAWFIAKLSFGKNFVSKQEFDTIQNQLQTLGTQKAISDRDAGQYKTEAENAKADLVSTTSNLNTANRRISELEAKIDAKQQLLDVQVKEIEDIGSKFEKSFESLAQKVLEAKTEKFSAEQEKNLKVLLSPLQTEINKFKEDVVSRQQQESDERISLREQVKNMTQLNQTLSEQANKLTETLRLQVKQQGDWGESILEAILENSGLQKGLQYFTQQSSRNNDGKLIRPDVLVKYPDQRTIIIDSKVSLVHYYNMCSVAGEGEQQVCLRQLLDSIRGHIDELAGKNYQDVTQALDFVIMFVPVETAYIAAMHADQDLWQYAYKKRILLISPANLIATLKLVKDMWRKDAIDKNAQEIAKRAGLLYDKLVGFVETFESVGAQIKKAGQTWEAAYGQLTTGKANLISQGVKLKSLHIDAKKALPEQLSTQALYNDESHTDEKMVDGISLFE